MVVLLVSRVVVVIYAVVAVCSVCVVCVVGVVAVSGFELLLWFSWFYPVQLSWYYCCRLDLCC